MNHPPVHTKLSDQVRVLASRTLRIFLRSVIWLFAVTLVVVVPAAMPGTDRATAAVIGGLGLAISGVAFEFWVLSMRSDRRIVELLEQIEINTRR